MSNCTETVTTDPNVWNSAVIQRITTLVVIMTFTLVGNISIIIVLTCINRERFGQKRVTIYMVNLAIGDLLVCCIAMTTEILFVCFQERWVLGEFMCKLLVYAEIVTLASTTFILMCMSWDRFMAICRPLDFSVTIGRTKAMVAMCWGLACVFAIPQLLIFVQTDEGARDGVPFFKCSSLGYTATWQRKAYFTFMTTYILVIPGCMITYCYSRIIHTMVKQVSCDDVTDNS